MNEIQLFNNPDFGNIRAIEINNEPWFVGRDIAAVLGYAKPQNAIASHVDKDDTLIQGITDNLGRKQSTTLINESGVYALIFGSKLPDAKKFKHWVTSEVLPKIRKTGSYSVSPNAEQTALMNARTMNANVYVSLLDYLDTKSESYRSILIAYAANTAAGQLVLPFPKAEFGKTYSASDIGQIFGISRQMVGRISNQHGLKSDEFGEWYHDIARNGKEIDNFRYNENAISRFREILSAL